MRIVAGVDEVGRGSLIGPVYAAAVILNKSINTKLLKEIQPMQYVGIVFCIIACLPFIQYFFMGFLSEGGSMVMENLVDN